MNKWLGVVLLALSVLASAMALKAVSAKAMLAELSSPVPRIGVILPGELSSPVPR